MFTLRRFIIFFLIFALCFSFSAPVSFANPLVPVAIGEYSGVLAFLLASLMGVDYSLSVVDTTSLNTFFSTSVLSNPIWASKIYGGLATLNLGLDALDLISSFSASRITSDSIQDDSSGSLTPFSYLSFFGIALNSRIGSKYVSPFIVQSIGPGSSGSFDYGPVHCSYSVNNSNRFYYTCTFQGRSESGNFYKGSETSFGFGFQCNGASDSVSFGMYNLDGSFWTSSSLIGLLGYPSSVNVSASYSSGTVDTSVSQGLPPTGGLTVTFPSTATDTNGLLSDLASLLATNPDYVQASIVDDAGVPVSYDTPISDEPYSSLSGALSGIQSVISSISSSVSGIAESIVGADSTFFGNVVSALAAPFEPIFTIFRSGVSIWRYVVSWVGTISAPFSWSLSALGSAGSYFLSPIYAAAAAAVVLAVYKKFGR